MLRGTVQFFRIMGLEPTTEPVPIETTRRLRHPDDGERVLQDFNDSLARGADYIEAEYRIIRPDGELRWIFGRGRVIRDADRHAGAPLAASISTSPVASWPKPRCATARSGFAACSSRVRSARRWRGSTSVSARSIPALCEMLGYTADELIGRSFLDVVHPDDRDQCAALGQALIDGSAPQIQIEERFVRKSGDALLGERQCRSDPRCGRQDPLYTRRHREHRRTQAHSPRRCRRARHGCGY